MTRLNGGQRRLAALATCVVSALALASGARAQALRQYSIAGGELKAALSDFARQSDREIMFNAALVSDKKTRGYSGQSTAPEVLSRLLNNTGLTYASTSAGTLLVVPRAVEAPAAEAAAHPPPVRPKTAAAAESRIIPDTSFPTAIVREVIVTGTSLRGVSPVGSDLFVVDRQAIESTDAQTVQQILKAVPALSNMGQSSQGGGATTPAIHNLGAISSYSTLVLIDGHRFSPGRQQQPLPDPGILPPTAIERVEVLADGASSIYGSDAVAGVINFVTRKNFEGLETNAQAGFGDHYRTRSASILAGRNWTGGNLMVTGVYSFRSMLYARHRDFMHPDHQAQGGSNFSNFNCDPAVLQPGGTGDYFLSAAAASSVTNASVNAPCSTYPYAAALPADTRAHGMVKISQAVGSRLTVGLDVVYSDRRSKWPSARGTYGGTAFKTGPQANPFYTNPEGYTGAAESMVVRWDADELLGPGAYSIDNSRNYFASAVADYALGDDWEISALAMYGREVSRVGAFGVLCGSCAHLALNGTPNANGAMTTSSLSGSGSAVLGLPLTVENALDVWRPAASNRTAAAVRERLADSDQISVWYHSATQLRVSIDGTLATLPAGDLRVAAGVEHLRATIEINRTSPNNTGPSSIASQFLHIPLARSVESAYAESFVPLISPEMRVALVRRLTLNASIRHDRYSDVGTTANPRLGVDWELMHGFKLRASLATAFVAPHLSSVGDRARGGLTSFTCFGSNCPGITIAPFTVQVADFPGAIGLPGCPAGTVTCIVPLTTTGVQYNSGPADPKPSQGKTWSVGFDAKPPAIPGLTVGASLFNVRYIDFITGTSLSNAVTAPALNLIEFFPNGATPADLERILPQFAQLQGNLPTTIYYLVSARQGNFNNLDVQGVDASFTYRRETRNLGVVSIGGAITRFTKFNQRLKGSRGWYSILNTSGINSTFGAIKTQARYSVGWRYGPSDLNLFVNHIGPYRNWSSSARQPVVLVGGLPMGGGDRVGASVILDLSLRYDLPWRRRGAAGPGPARLFVDVTNLLDAEPPFFNNANGFDPFSGNPTGRVVTAGLRAKF
jgi:iron complex outermembrane recepter protein